MPNEEGRSRVQSYPPFAQPDTRRRRGITVPEGAADPPAEDDLPPIEQFLDELPSIDDYIADEAPPIENYVFDEGMSQQQVDSEGWALSGWQSYDWTRLSALARTPSERAEAEANWGETDWLTGRESSEDRESDAGDLSAEEVARALDGIADRIRSGE